MIPPSITLAHMNARHLLSLATSLLLWALLSACTSPAPTETVSDNTATSTAPAKLGGLALYTLRDTMASDPKGVLKAVADLGYAYVESAGYDDGRFYGMTPPEFKVYLAEVGLRPMSSHNGGITMENLDQTIADVKAAGFGYLVIPVPPMGAFKFDPATRTLSMTQTTEEVMTNINTIADRVSSAGLKCLYHNHDFEFKADADGVTPIDYFLENSDPAKLNFQMDLYWVTRAEADPVAYFSDYPGRFKAWHVKDMDAEGRFVPVGEGSIDFARILAEKDQSGMEFYLVEQDATFNETPMEAIAISHRELVELGFE